jgi:hypothetical protein
MKKAFLASHIVGLCLSFQLHADLKLSDFETETKQNCLGWDWYYYSDVKDGGNSQIFNSTMKPDYSYEDFKSADSGYNSNKCGRIIYKHGNYRPCGLENNYWPFVGIGTDITKPSTETSLQNLQNIRFSAKCSKQKTRILVDIMFSYAPINGDNILQTGYFQYMVLVDTAWNIYSVPVQEMNERMMTCEMDHHLTIDQCLQHAMKIEWYIEKPFSLPADTCILSIDDVYLIGIDSLPRNTIVNTIVPIAKFIVNQAETGHTYRYDLLGKCMANAMPMNIPGLFILKSNKILQINHK